MTSLSSLFGAKGNGTGLASTGIKTAHHVAQPNQCVSTDTTGGSITVTLPASPDHGDIVAIVDAARAWGVHALTVDGNGTTIDGAAGNKAFAVPGSYVELRYDANTDDWQLLLTPEIPGQAGNAGKFLTTDGSAASWAAAPLITQTPPVYVTSGGSTTLTATSVVAAYEQIAGTTFNLTYNAESDYVQEDAANGTDLTGGAFVLHNTAGAVIDGNTKLLIHADGSNGDTAIIDERGITPFGTHCMYFDGASYFKVPSSHKVAFGASQDFTIECWINIAFMGGGASQFAWDLRSTDFSSGISLRVTENSGVWPPAGPYRFRLLGWNNAINVGPGSGTFNLNTWCHVAVVRNSGILKLYVDGVEAASVADTNAYTAQALVLGANATGTVGTFIEGWMSNLRVSKIARYTGNFTRPSVEFTRDADTVYLFKGYDGHGSQLIRDDSRSGREIQLPGNSTITNTRAKFGMTSLNCATSGAVVQATKGHADFNIGADDFTWDCWFYPASPQTAVLMSFGDVWTAWGPHLRIKANGQLSLEVSSNGSSWNISADTTDRGAYNVNQWNHVALTRRGTNVYLLLNGVLQATLPVSTASLFHGSAYQLYLGLYSSGNAPFTGQIDEVRVKRGVAEWTSTFTPPTAPYTTDDRTVLLLHFEGANGDKVTLDSSESSYGNDQFGGTTIPALTLQGSAALSSAQSRGGNSTSLALSGTSQWAQLTCATPSPGHPIYFAPWEQFCIEGWFYISSFANSPVLFWIGDGSTASTEMYLDFNNIGQPRFYVGATQVASTYYTYATGWHHIAVVRDGRGYTMFVDGSALAPENPQINPSYGAVTYYLGLGSYRASITGFMSGAIDSFRITHGKPRYTANFTPGNITADDDTTLCWVFNGSVGQKWVKELSKNTATVSAINARTVRDGRFLTPMMTGQNICINTSSPKFGTGRVSAGGPTGNSLTIPFTYEMLPPGDFTFDLWMIPSGYQKQIMEFRNGSPQRWCMYHTAAGKLEFFYSDTTQASVTVTSTTTISLSVWTHIAVVRTAGLLKLYVNGVQEASVTATNGLYQDTAGTVFLFSATGGQNTFSGVLDEIRISNTARWTSNFTPPAIPYGQQYVTGPCYVTTSNASRIDVSTFSSIDNVAVSETLNPGTTIKYLASFDGRATWKYWNGSAWTTTTLAAIEATGTTGTDFKAGLLAWTPALGTTIDVAASLKTTNPTFTPALDSITVTMDEYQAVRMIDDVSVKRLKAGGAQTHRLTRVKAGNANMVFDCVT